MCSSTPLCLNLKRIKAEAYTRIARNDEGISNIEWPRIILVLKYHDYFCGTNTIPKKCSCHVCPFYSDI